MKLSHISIRCRELHTSRRFYEEFFNAKIVHTFLSSESVIYGFFLRLPEGGLIELIQSDHVFELQKGNIDHFCIETESIQSLLELIPPQYVATQLRRGRTDRVLQFSVRDPNGVIIEIHQFDGLASFRP